MTRNKNRKYITIDEAKATLAIAGITMVHDLEHELVVWDTSRRLRVFHNKVGIGSRAVLRRALYRAVRALEGRDA